MNIRAIIIALLFFFASVSHINAAGVICTPAGGGTGVDTAIGCVPISDENQFVGFFLSWGIAIAGGIGTLLAIYGGFIYMTSQGDPRKAKLGQEIITGTVGGLLLLIFSAFILRIIGVDVLQIPGL